MLRIVLMVLVAANLLYFTWTHTVGDGKPELTAASAPSTAARPAQRPAAPPGPPPCATLGPFFDAALVESADAELRDAGLSPARRSATEQVREGWWVYVANADAATQARTLDLLRRWNMRDAVAMADDPEFRVSVGIYSQEARAEDRAQLVQRLKLEAKVVERFKPQPATWFDVPGMARATLADGRLRKTDLPLDRLRIEACPPPAQKPSGAAEDASTGDAVDPQRPPRTGMATAPQAGGRQPARRV